MSRLTKKAIDLSPPVTARLIPRGIILSGPRGELEVKVPAGVRVEVGDGKITVLPEGNTKKNRANSGTAWSLIRSAVVGVKEGFSKTLEMEGIGLRAAIEGRDLVLSLGYVEPVRFPIPDGITVTVDKNIIRVSGVNKQQVGLVAAKIRHLKKPEPYKGKGIRYQGEVIRRKVGKKAATAAG